MKLGNKNLLSVAAVFLITFVASSADGPTGSISFANMSSDKVLVFYKEMSKCQLIEATDVKNHHRDISIRHNGSKEETLRAIEKAIVEQAGIVVTGHDGTRVSVP